MKKKLLLVMFLVCGISQVKPESRNVDINHSDGDKTNLSFDNLDKITFAGDMVVFNYLDKTVSVIQMDEIRSLVFNIPLGVEQNRYPEFTLNAWPNPAKDVVYITGIPSGTTDINIYSLSGALVKSVKSHDVTKPLNVADLSAGIYFLNTGDGNIKLIKD